MWSLHPLQVLFNDLGFASVVISPPAALSLRAHAAAHPQIPANTAGGGLLAALAVCGCLVCACSKLAVCLVQAGGKRAGRQCSQAALGPVPACQGSSSSPLGCCPAKCVPEHWSATSHPWHPTSLGWPPQPASACCLLPAPSLLSGPRLRAGGGRRVQLHPRRACV